MKLILLVEDHNDTAAYLQEKLHEHGYQVEVARDGEEALQMVSERHAAVILDYHLPKRMGDSVCQHIRDNPVTKHIPVVFITADGAAQVQHLLEPGRTVCLEKAISTADLVKALDELTGKQAQAGSK